MTRLIPFGLLSTLLFAAGCTPTEAEANADEKGFAVVELFTSEGCSSCPPADAVLAELAADARTNSRPVYVLSFHVDYWNRLGWKDPYSDATYTKRQSEYSQRFNSDTNYTPQMIVNGVDEFVGSDRARTFKAITTALSQKATASVGLKATAEGKAISVRHTIKGAPAESVLCVAWVEAETMQKPDRGENGGRKLTHVNVVRDFRTVELKAKGESQLALQRPDIKSGSVIAFVQDPKTGRILGAAQVDVP